MAAKKKSGLSDSELATRLEQMNRAAIGHMSDDVSAEQDSNLERYLGMPYGDEEDGRSQAVSMDVAQVVDWAVPDILEPYISGDRVVEFEPSSKAEEEYCDWATDLVNHEFFVENNGVMFLHDVVKTGAIQKIGFSKTVWEVRDEEFAETITGVSAAHLAELQADTSLTIDSVESEPLAGQIADELAAQAFTDGNVYTVTITRTRKTGCNRLIAVPPERMKFSARTCDLRDIDYICHEEETNRSALIEMGFDEDLVATIKAAGHATDQARDEVRFSDESRRDGESSDRASEILVLCEEYPLIDVDGDGRLERLQVFRVGKTILKQEEVDEHPFDGWSPDRIPNRLVGLAVADKVKQTAKIKTHLTRQLLDNVYLANNPRIEVPEGAENKNTVADILNYRIGGLIRTKGAGGMLRPIEIPDRSATALQAILYMDGVREQESGVTRNGMAVSSEAIDPKSATESRRQDRNEQVRKRLMCRILGETFLVPVFKKLLKNLIRYQDAAKDIKIRGEWTAIDPRPWNADLKCRLRVGLGHANRDELLMAATTIGQAQQLAMQVGIVEPKHVYKIAAKMVEAAGLRFADDYFLNPETEEGQKAIAAKQQAAAQDPKLAAEMAKVQLKQVEGQVKSQLQAQDMAHKQQIAEMQAGFEFKIAQMEAAMEFKLGQLKIAAEAQLSREQMEGEMELAAWRDQQNTQIKRDQVSRMPARQNGSTGSGVRFGGKVG